MFEQLKAMGAVAALLKDKQRLREAAARVTAAMEAARATGEAGGGAVRVTVNGKMRVLDVVCAPGLGSGDAQSRQMAGAFIAEATNEALARAQAIVHEAVRREWEALGLPPLPDEIKGLLP